MDGSPTSKVEWSVTDCQVMIHESVVLSLTAACTASHSHSRSSRQWDNRRWSPRKMKRPLMGRFCLFQRTLLPRFVQCKHRADVSLHDASVIISGVHLPEKKLIQAKHNLRNHRTARWSSHHILHAKVGQVTDERAGRSTVCERISPKHPLNCDHGRHEERLEEHRQRWLAPWETAIKQADSRDNQPDDEAAEDEICVVELEARVLEVDVHEERVAAAGLAEVENGLAGCVSMEERLAEKYTWEKDGRQSSWEDRSGAQRCCQDLTIRVRRIQKLASVMRRTAKGILTKDLQHSLWPIDLNSPHW